VTFYEAKPVNIKIRLIASSFYPSFHVWPINLLSRGLIQLMRRRPSSVASSNAHFTDRAVVQTIITNFKLLKPFSLFNVFRRGEKNLASYHAATFGTFTFSFRQLAPSRSIAQQRISNFLATAVIAIFLRDALPRNIR
jgi:hypothetical protein